MKSINQKLYLSVWASSSAQVVHYLVENSLAQCSRVKASHPLTKIIIKMWGQLEQRTSWNSRFFRTLNGWPFIIWLSIHTVVQLATYLRSFWMDTFRWQAKISLSLVLLTLVNAPTFGAWDSDISLLLLLVCSST